MNDNVTKYNWKERKNNKKRNRRKHLQKKKYIINKFKEKMAKMHKN